MNILLIIVLFIIVLFAIKGYAKGLFGLFFSVFSWVLVFAFVLYGSPKIEDALLTRTGTYEFIQEKVQIFIMDQLENSTLEELKEKNLLLKEFSTEETAPIEGLADLALYNARLAIANSLSKNIASFAVHGLSYIIAVLAAQIIASLFKNILVALYSGRSLYGTSRLLGMLIGLVSGVLVSDILLYAIYCFSMTELAQRCMTDIEQSQLLTYMFTHNYFMQILALIQK